MVVLVTHSVWNPFEATMSAASTLYNDDQGVGDSVAVNVLAQGARIEGVRGEAPALLVRPASRLSVSTFALAIFSAQSDMLS